MARVKGVGNNVSFTADADNVEQVWPSGATSGFVGKPCMWGIHTVECKPLAKYFSLLWDYLFTSNTASVQYLRAGKRRGQSVPEQVWAWGMGRPASKHTTHNEQVGYASMSREQFLGLDSAVGTTFEDPQGNQVMFTAEMAECMRDQIDGLAGDYADWCKRWGYTPHLGDMDEVIRGCNGEEVGCAMFHYQASEIPGTTTFHTDPGKGRYPADVFISKAISIFNGGSIPAPPQSLDLLEEIMALDRTSDDYKNLVGDIADRVLAAPVNVSFPNEDPKQVQLRDVVSMVASQTRSIWQRSADEAHQEGRA